MNCTTRAALALLALLASGDFLGAQHVVNRSYSCWPRTESARITLVEAPATPACPTSEAFRSTPRGLPVACCSTTPCEYACPEYEPTPASRGRLLSFLWHDRECGDCPGAGWKDTCREWALDEWDKIQCDFRNMYTGKHLMGLGLAIGIAAPLANTAADENFRNWYQSHGRSRDADRWAEVGNAFGEHWTLVPVAIAATAGGYLTRDCWEGGGAVATWGERTCRALLIGAPAVGVLQYGLGAGRPEEGGSDWRPFHDTNAVAGHGFIGAVPFLVAATCTESRPLKAAFFAGSFFTTWSRIHDDSHYLSQAVLGWSIAYLAVQSVYQTDLDRQSISLVPLDIPNGAGVGVLIRY